jgi:dihydrofolate reductase
MRELIVTENITVDGVIDMAEGWFDPAGDGTDQSDLQEAIKEQRDAADAVLLGRVTFEQMRGYWPQQTDDTTGITDYLNQTTKHVVSSTMENPQWENTTVLRGPLVEEVGRLKAAPGKDVVATGSMTLVSALIAEGLVDEYRLFVYPVVVGTGTRLFADATQVPRLRLVETRPFHSGVVLLRYRTA